jgi:polyhydroxybutyrate depolymerase
MRRILRLSLRALSLGFLLMAAAGAHAAGLEVRVWDVDGVSREGLVHVPAPAVMGDLPVVFVFHGHGGSMRQVSLGMSLHELWPEALVVYLQGLPTPGKLTDPTGRRTGWQSGPGDQADRDLRFFDAVLRSLRELYRVDEKRIYATGHSNGGAFTYLLWAKRREVFAAFAPSAAIAGRDYGRLDPAPVLHVAGATDDLVRFPWQELMIKVLRRTNGCGPGEPAGTHCTLYPSPGGTPVMTFIHPGGHGYPPAASARIVEFFKAHPRS